MALEIAPGIVVDPEILSGKPVIKGTRLPVETVLGELGGGMTYEEVQAEYEISQEDIRAALLYAASVIADEVVRAVA